MMVFNLEEKDNGHRFLDSEMDAATSAPLQKGLLTQAGSARRFIREIL